MSAAAFRLLCLIPLLCLWGTPVLAEKIAVVDTQRILRESLAAKHIRKIIDGKRNAYQKQIKSKEASLRKAEKELAKQRAILSAEALDKKRKAFRSKLVTAQKDVQKKRARLERAYARSMGTIQKEIYTIISGMAGEKGFRVALPTGQTLYAEPALDITGEVLTRLNKNLPKVNVEIK